MAFRALTAKDGSNQKGDKMGAGFINLRRKKRRGQKKVGREEEGSSSNRPEFVALVEALCGTKRQIHVVLVRQSSAAQGCDEMGGQRWKNNISRSP